MLALFTFYALPSSGKLKGAMVHCAQNMPFVFFIHVQKNLRKYRFPPKKSFITLMPLAS